MPWPAARESAVVTGACSSRSIHSLLTADPYMLLADYQSCTLTARTR